MGTIKDIFDDRDGITRGFFHYCFWILGLMMSTIVPIVMSFMKDYYYLPKEAVELGSICIGLGFGIIIYRVGVIVINSLTESEKE